MWKNFMSVFDGIRAAFKGRAAICVLVALFMSALQGAAQAQDYRLGPDDVIGITVLKHPEFSVDNVTVPSSGKIQLPIVGAIVVTGKPVSQVEREITKALRKELLRPQVTVSIRQQRPRRVFLQGAVNKPGVYDLKPGGRVTEALAMAGGLSARPERVDGTLSRGKKKPIQLNLAKLMSDSDSSANIVLQPNDVLILKERVVRVSVAGQVQKSGTYDVPVESSVLEAVGIAGGPTAKAALTKVLLKRPDGAEVPIDLYKVIVLGQPEPKVELQAGDLIIVPEAKEKVTVLGAVLKPGYYDIEDGRGLNVSEAVALAGNPSPRAALTKAVVRHANGTETPVDLYKITVLGLQDGNLKLQPGDAVSIPESRGVAVLGEVKNPGTYYIEAGKAPRLSDALGQAGGLRIKPEEARITIARSTPAARSAGGAVGSDVTSVTHIDPVKLIELTDPNQDERIQDGDIVTVSAIKRQIVTVSGQVRTPGAYELKEGEGVPELIARAGGPTPLAALRKVSVRQPAAGEQPRTYDIYAAVLEGGPRPNIPVRDGTFVVVPENLNRVLVMPAVMRPGPIPIPENRLLTIGEALGMAGGPKDRAKLHEIALIRQTSTGQAEQQIISLKQVKNGQSAMSIVLRNGDILYVPEGRIKPTVLDTISRGAATLFSVFGALF